MRVFPASLAAKVWTCDLGFTHHTPLFRTWTAWAGDTKKQGPQRTLLGGCGGPKSGRNQCLASHHSALQDGQQLCFKCCMEPWGSSPKHHGTFGGEWSLHGWAGHGGSRCYLWAVIFNDHMVLGNEHLTVNPDRLKIRESSPKFQDCLNALIPKYNSGKDAGFPATRIMFFHPDR